MRSCRALASLALLAGVFSAPAGAQSSLRLGGELNLPTRDFGSREGHDFSSKELDDLASRDLRALILQDGVAPLEIEVGQRWRIETSVLDSTFRGRGRPFEIPLDPDTVGWDRYFERHPADLDGFSERVGTCSSAAKRFRDVYQLLAMTPDVLPPGIAEAAAAYDKSCLSGPAVDLVPVLHGLDESVGILGQISADGSRIFPLCMGLQVSPDSVLSARHCLLDRETGSSLAWLYPSDTTLAFVALRAGAPTTTLEPDPKPPLVGPFTSNLDVAIYRSHDMVAADWRLKPVQAALTEAAPLRIAGYFDEFTQVRDARDPTTWPTIDEARSRVRWSNDLPAACHLVMVESGCVYHSCQAVRGFSGSLILPRDAVAVNGELPIVGLHLAAAGLDSRCSHRSGLNVGMDWDTLSLALGEQL